MTLIARFLVTVVVAVLMGAGGSAGVSGGSAGSASGSASAPAPPCLGRATGSWDHVVVILMENHSYAQVAGHSPYLNRLARRCGLAKHYFAVTHPSLPNYLALTSGKTFLKWSASDCTASPLCSTGARSLFAEVRSWKAYEEHMTSNCQITNDDIKHYAVRHNPPPYYTKIAKACAKRDVPLGATTGGLVDDLANDALPRFSFITPDLRHDEHDAAVSVGDKWLSRWVPKIIHSDTYAKGGTALFITYDEGETSSNQIYTVVVAPSVKKHTVVRRRFTHYSMLRTWQQMLGVHCLRNSCHARSMRKAFRL